MIGGRIFDHTVLVGFALGRSVYVLAAGKLACPGCAAPLRCAAGYMPPHGEPSRCGLRPAVGADARDPMLGAIPPRHTPAGPRRRGDGATGRRARSAVCRVAARLAAICWFIAGLLAHVPAGVQLGIPGRTAPATTCARTPDTMHTNDPVGTPLMLTPNVAYMVIPSGGNS